jgi:hypothetical protein
MGDKGFESQPSQWIFLLYKISTRLCGSQKLLFNESWGSFRGQRGQGVKLTHSHLLLRVRMNGGTPLIHPPTYAFMEWLGTNLTVFISSFRLVMHVVFLFLGDSPAYGFYVPTFRYTLFHLHRLCVQEERTVYIACEDGTECSETSAKKFWHRGITRK